MVSQLKADDTSFYVFIPSDGDTGLRFSDNRISNFSIEFKQPIRFGGVPEAWEVALSEIMVPNSCFNVTGDMGRFIIGNEFYRLRCELPEGQYTGKKFARAVSALTKKVQMFQYRRDWVDVLFWDRSYPGEPIHRPKAVASETKAVPPTRCGMYYSKAKLDLVDRYAKTIEDHLLPQGTQAQGGMARVAEGLAAAASAAAAGTLEAVRNLRKRKFDQAMGYKRKTEKKRDPFALNEKLKGIEVDEREPLAKELESLTKDQHNIVNRDEDVSTAGYRSSRTVNEVDEDIWELYTNKPAPRKFRGSMRYNFVSKVMSCHLGANEFIYFVNPKMRKMLGFETEAVSYPLDDSLTSAVQNLELPLEDRVRWHTAVEKWSRWKQAKDYEKKVESKSEAEKSITLYYPHEQTYNYRDFQTQPPPPALSVPDSGPWKDFPLREITPTQYFWSTQVLHNYKELDENVVNCPFPAQFETGQSEAMFVYTNIIRPSMIGDVMAPVLRVIHFGDKIHTSSPDAAQGIAYQKFLDPQYFTVNQDNIKQLDIKLADGRGRDWPVKRGRALLVLHFRKKKNFPRKKYLD